MAKSDVIKKAAAGYAEVGEKYTRVSQRHLNKVANGGAVDKGASHRTSTMGAWMEGNLQQAAFKGGHSSVLGMAGSHAIRGAAWGAVAGGSIEAAQGGSFWDGAKQGAFNGAVGWTGYRMGMKAVGANKINPLAGMKGASSDQGIIAGAQNMWRATGGADANVSKQAVAILNNRQQEGYARALMNASNKRNARQG